MITMVAAAAGGGGGQAGGVSGLGLSRVLLEWLVLRRVRDGGVTKVGQGYLDHGRRTPDYLAGPIEGLVAAGLLVLGEPDPVTEARRPVVLTEAGLDRYAVVSRDHSPRVAAGGSPGEPLEPPGWLDLDLLAEAIILVARGGWDVEEMIETDAQRVCILSGRRVRITLEGGCRELTAFTIPALCTLLERRCPAEMSQRCPAEMSGRSRS